MKKRMYLLHPSTQIATSISVQIDGVIDLGPNWNYEYKMESVKAIPYTPKATRQKWAYRARVKGTTKTWHRPVLRYNKYEDNFTSNSLYDKPHIVKDDEKIIDFTYHVYKQALKVFDEIKKKVNPDIAFRVDMLARNYDEKFQEFINETLNQNIKTRLGPQRVIMNTIDTSSRLLKRLVNYFIGDMHRDGLLRNNEVAVNVFQNEVDRECNLEMMHVCSKFGICRTSKSFSNFMIEFLTIIMTNEERKIKIAMDAMTEVLKEADFSPIMGKSTRSNFLKTIEMIERWDGAKSKATFWIAKNLFALKNQPLRVMMDRGGHVNKTVAALEVIDEIDKIILATEDNILEWTDLKNSLRDWSKGKRDDILEVMQGLMNHFIKKGIKKMDKVTAQKINSKLDIIFS